MHESRHAGVEFHTDSPRRVGSDKIVEGIDEHFIAAASGGSDGPLGGDGGRQRGDSKPRGSTRPMIPESSKNSRNRPGNRRCRRASVQESSNPGIVVRAENDRGTGYLGADVDHGLEFGAGARPDRGKIEFLECVDRNYSHAGIARHPRDFGGIPSSRIVPSRISFRSSTLEIPKPLEKAKNSRIPKSGTAILFRANVVCLSCLSSFTFCERSFACRTRRRK